MEIDKRVQIIEALENKSAEEIDDEFKELIEDKMTNSQFWKYVASWKDAGDMVEQMEEWSTDTKRDAIREIKRIFKIE